MGDSAMVGASVVPEECISVLWEFSYEDIAKELKLGPLLCSPGKWYEIDCMTNSIEDRGTLPMEVVVAGVLVAGQLGSFLKVS